MSLYDDASLILYPSGYKEDKIYSLKPTDGNGDLDFTRASTATRVNSDGLIEKVRTNLALYSEDATNGVYTKINITVTADSTTAPDGTLTADTITATAASGNLQGVVTITSGLVYTVSVWLKRKTGTGTIQLRGVSNTSTTVSITSEWARYSVSLTASDIYGRYGVLLQDSGDEVYAWGFQLEVGDIATEYIPTTTTAVSVGMLANVPRIDYTGGGCGKLLLESQRSNLVTYSEQIDNAAWGKTNATITANSTISPDGTQNADKVIADTTNGVHRIEQDKATAAQVATQSVFAKASGYNFIAVENGGELAYFNISTGVVGSVSGGTASIQDYGNGWYRCILTATALNTKSYIYICSADNVITFAGDGTSGVYLCAAQFEANASYVSSYIPTLASSVTRLADTASKTGISSLIGQTEGSVFFDFEISNFSEAGGEKVLWYMKDTGTGERYVTVINDGRLIYVEYTTSSIAVIEKPSLTIGRHKCAIAYANNDFVFYVDGVQIGTDTSGTPNGYSTFGLQYYTTGASGSQQVNQAILFPTRLTNAQLETLTTI